MRISLRITEANPGHCYLSMWVNGGLVCSPGGICLRIEELSPFIRLIQPSRVELGQKLVDDPEIKRLIESKIVQ